MDLRGPARFFPDRARPCRKRPRRSHFDQRRPFQARPGQPRRDRGRKQANPFVPMARRHARERIRAVRSLLDRNRRRKCRGVLWRASRRLVRSFHPVLIWCKN